MPPPSNLDPAPLYANLIADPHGLGYAPLIASGNHEALAELLNEARSEAAWVRRNEAVPWPTVQAQFDASEFDNMSDPTLIQLQGLFKHPTVDFRLALFDDDSEFWSTFGSHAITDSNIKAIRTRPGSEAELIYDTPPPLQFPYVKPVVTHLDVAYALATEGGTIPE